MEALCRRILDQIMCSDITDNNILLNMDIWDWSQWVALYGIYQFYRHTDDQRVLDYLTDWFDRHLKHEQIRNVNTVCPLLTLCCLYEESGRQDYLDACCEWILSEMPRTAMGAFSI